MSFRGSSFPISRWLLLLGFVAGSLRGGVLITRTTGGLQFTEAVSIAINGKDKVYDLGPEAKNSVAVAKLPEIKLGGTIIKDSSGLPAIYSENGFLYFLPEGQQKNTVVKPDEAWTSAKLTFKKSLAEKTPQEAASSTFVAFLPGGIEELARLCNDHVALVRIGGQDKVFATQMELMAAAVKAYPADPGLAPLQRYVEQAMRSRLDTFESGLGTAALLDEALKMVELSKAVYPNQPEQEKPRQEVLSRKVWLDRKLAILHAFAAGGEWDSFLLGEKTFEKYEGAFPEFAALHTKALQQSLEEHRKYGEELLKDGDFSAALHEFRLAGLRQPSDRLLQQKAQIAWTDYSREAAAENKRKRKPLGSGEREVLNQSIQFAANYVAEKKLELAVKSISEAERVDPDSLPMLLKKAEILGARNDFSTALATLDRYDLLAVDEERDRASNLRNELTFRRTSALEDLKQQFTKAWESGNYHSARELAFRGLQARENDADLLYQAGLTSVILRDGEMGRKYFARYLDLSNTLDSDAKRRAQVRLMLTTLQQRNRVETGDPNWLSGKKLPVNVAYCPLSLAFQQRIERIDVSNPKMKTSFEWDGDRLAAIAPMFDKPNQATGEKRIAFGYDPSFPQVSVAVEGDARPPKPQPGDPDEMVKHSSLIILNNPYIDPDAVQKLTGRNITLGIAGNRYFHPFVWDKLHYFRFTYDSEGRVAEAAELSAPGGQLTGFVTRFEWSGLQLSAIHGYEGADAAHRTKVYDRTMDYQDGHIVAEEISSEGKVSRIKYTYNGGRLISAVCAADKTLDNRARQVFFR